MRCRAFARQTGVTRAHGCCARCSFHVASCFLPKIFHFKLSISPWATENVSDKKEMPQAACPFQVNSWAITRWSVCNYVIAAHLINRNRLACCMLHVNSTAVVCHRCWCILNWCWYRDKVWQMTNCRCQAYIYGIYSHRRCCPFMNAAACRHTSTLYTRLLHIQTRIARFGRSLAVLWCQRMNGDDRSNIITFAYSPNAIEMMCSKSPRWRWNT